MASFKFKSDEFTKWLGFDKYGKILIGVENDSPFEGYFEFPLTLKLKKLNVFNQDVNSLLNVTINRPDVIYYEEQNESLFGIDDSVTFALSHNGDVLAIGAWTTWRLYIKSNQSPFRKFACMNFDFYIINLENGEVKVYKNIRCRQGVAKYFKQAKITLTDICQVGASETVEQDKTISPTLFCTDSNQWLFRFNNECCRKYYYFRLLLYTNRNVGMFEFLTKRDFRNPGDMDSIELLRNELFFDGKMVAFFGEMKDKCLHEMCAYDFVGRTWTKIKTGYVGDVPKKHERFKLFGNGWNGLFAVSEGLGTIWKYDQDFNMWCKMDIVTRGKKLCQSIFAKKNNYTFNTFATQNLLVTTFWHYGLKDMDDHPIRFTVNNIQNVLSLRDICFITIANHYPHAMKSKEFMKLLPHTLVRHYFGPTYSLRHQVENNSNEDII